MKNYRCMLVLFLFGALATVHAGVPTLHLWCGSMPKKDTKSLAVVKSYVDNIDIQSSNSISLPSNKIPEMINELSEAIEFTVYTTFVDGLPVDMHVPYSKDSVLRVTVQKQFHNHRIGYAVDYLVSDKSSGTSYIWVTPPATTDGVMSGFIHLIPIGETVLVFCGSYNE